MQEQEARRRAGELVEGLTGLGAIDELRAATDAGERAVLWTRRGEECEELAGIVRQHGSVVQDIADAGRFYSVWALLAFALAQAERAAATQTPRDTTTFPGLEEDEYARQVLDVIAGGNVTAQDVVNYHAQLKATVEDWVVLSL